MTYTYESPVKLGRIVKWLLAATVLASLAFVVSSVLEYMLYDRPPPGGVDPEVAASHLNRQTTLLIVMAVFDLVTAVCFLFWCALVMRNAWSFRETGLRHSPSSAVWWWFVPFASLVMPYRVLREAWQASDVEPGEWTRSSVPTTFIAWWGLWIGSLVVAQFALFDGTDTDLKTPALWGAIEAWADVLAGVAAIRVVHLLTQRQVTRGFSRAEVFD